MAMEKAKALEMALSQIEKDFGKGAIMRLGDAASKISVSTIPAAWNWTLRLVWAAFPAAE